MRSVRRSLWSRDIGLKAKIGVDAAFQKGGLEVGAEAGFEAYAGQVVVSFPDRVRNFLIEGLRFRNQREVLLRLALQQHNSDNLLLGLKKLWSVS
jgi:hypothetical protein